MRALGRHQLVFKWMVESFGFSSEAAAEQTWQKYFDIHNSTAKALRAAGLKFEKVQFATLAPGDESSPRALPRAVIVVVRTVLGLCSPCIGRSDAESNRTVRATGRSRAVLGGKL